MNKRQQEEAAKASSNAADERKPTDAHKLKKVEVDSVAGGRSPIHTPPQ